MVDDGESDGCAMITLCLAWAVYFGPVDDATRHQEVRAPECRPAPREVAKWSMLACATQGPTCKVVVDGERIILQRRFSCGVSP